MLDILNIKEIVTPEEFKNTLNYFTDFDLEDKRLELYTQYADKNNCSTEEAKDQILRTFFSNYILKSIKNAVELAKEDNQDAFSLINQLEELKPIFKEYDVNTFASFISSVEKGLSVTNSEILFNTHYVGDEFLEAITTNLIKSISNPNQKVKTVSDFTQRFFTHPLLHCLQAKNEMDKTLDHIENGTLEVGQYKQLISLVLQHRTEKNDESVDFFISYLVKEDILNGFYNIFKNENYKPEEIKNLLLKVSKGETLYAFELENAIKSVAELKVTISTDAEGEIKYTNTSSKTLNDSGFHLNIGEENYLFHLHTAQNKGENQNGQQATTLNVLNMNDIKSLSCTFVKKNAGSVEHGLDICRKYGFELQPAEKILLSNSQYEADLLSVLSSSFEDADLSKTTYLSSNLRIIKDSVKDSIKYNQMHFGLSDKDIITSKSSLFVSFIDKNFEKLEKIKNTTDSQMSVQSQIISLPLINTFKHFLILENSVGVLFSNEQINVISNFIKNKSHSPLVNVEQKTIKDILKYQTKNRNNLEENPLIFNDVLKTVVVTQDLTINTDKEKRVGYNKKHYEKIKINKQAKKLRQKILQNTKESEHNTINSILDELDKDDIRITEGDYSSSFYRHSQFFAYRMKSDVNNQEKSEKTYNYHIQTINSICEYAKLKDRKIYSYKKDYTNGFKP